LGAPNASTLKKFTILRKPTCFFDTDFDFASGPIDILNTVPSASKVVVPKTVLERRPANGDQEPAMALGAVGGRKLLCLQKMRKKKHLLLAKS